MTNPLPTVPVHAIDWTRRSCSGWCATRPPPPSGLSAAAPRLASRGLASISPSRSRPALPPSGRFPATPPDRPWCRRGRSAPRPRPCLPPATAVCISPASTCRSSLPTGYASIPNAPTRSRPDRATDPPGTTAVGAPGPTSFSRRKQASDISSCSPFCAPSTAADHLALILVHRWPSAPAAISASPCAAPPICMPGPTPAISCGAPTTVCNYRRAPLRCAPDPLLLRLSGGWRDQPDSRCSSISADAPPPPLPEARPRRSPQRRPAAPRTVLRQRLREQRSSRCRPPNSPTTRPRRPRNGWHLPS